MTNFIERVAGALIPAPVKAALAGGIVLAVLGAGLYVHHKIYQSGYDSCMADVAAATKTAADKAEVNVTKVGVTYAPKLKKILSAPDGAGPVGPVTTRALNGL